MTTNDIQKLETYGQAHEHALLDMLTQITSLPSPTGAEAEKAAFILEYLHNLGASDTHIDQAGNVVCPYQITGSGKHPLYGAHIDTVFLQCQEITPRIEGNLFAAPSCGDNSANVASLLCFITMLYEEHIDLPGGAYFLFNTGEEGLGNLRGIRQFMADHSSEISEMVAVDCNSDTCIHKAVGSHRYEINVTAQGGHSWSGFGNTSAIASAAAIIDDLYHLSVPKDPKTTYNAGTIEGGTTVNSIAEHAMFRIDLRSEDKDALDAVDKEFHQILKQNAKEGIEIRETLIGERPCSSGVDTTALCQRLEQIRAARGLTTDYQAGSTDANIPLSLGIPAISFGTCIGRRAHTVEENLDIDSLVPGFIQLAQFILSRPH